MSIEQLLVDRLATQVTLLRREQIWAVEAPQDAPTPYITYQQIDDNPLEGMTASHGMTVPNFQIDCWAATVDEARAIGAQVRAALKRWTDHALSPEILDCFMEHDFDVPRDFEEPEPRLYRRSSGWVIWHRE